MFTQLDLSTVSRISTGMDIYCFLSQTLTSTLHIGLDSVSASYQQWFVDTLHTCCPALLHASVMPFLNIRYYAKPLQFGHCFIADVLFEFGKYWQIQKPIQFDDETSSLPLIALRKNTKEVFFWETESSIELIIFIANSFLNILELHKA